MEGQTEVVRLLLDRGDDPDLVDDSGTPLQSANHGDVDLIVYAYGYPPEQTTAELLDPAV